MTGSIDGFEVAGSEAQGSTTERAIEVSKSGAEAVRRSAPNPYLIDEMSPQVVQGDLWLHDRLAALYLAPLHEPLPARFRKPLDDLRQMLRERSGSAR